MSGYKRRKVGLNYPEQFIVRKEDASSYNSGNHSGSTLGSGQAVFVQPTVSTKNRHRKSQEKALLKNQHIDEEPDETSSINCEEQSDFSQIFEVEGQYGKNADFGATGGIDSEDSVAAIRKSKNREAAKISRQKKKAELELIHSRLERLIKENNKLKLDNAALRAENSIVKRQLNYFENLFATKNLIQYDSRK